MFLKTTIDQISTPVRPNKIPSGRVTPDQLGMPEGDREQLPSFEEQINQARQTNQTADENRRTQTEQAHQIPEEEQINDERLTTQTEQVHQTPEEEGTASTIFSFPDAVYPIEMASNELDQIMAMTNLKANASTEVLTDHVNPNVAGQVESANALVPASLEGGEQNPPIPTSTIQGLSSQLSSESISIKTEAVTTETDGGPRGMPSPVQGIPAEVDRHPSEPRPIPISPQAEMMSATKQQTAVPVLPKQETPQTAPPPGEATTVKPTEAEILSQFNHPSSQSDGQDRPTYQSPRPTIEYTPLDPGLGSRDSVTPSVQTAVPTQAPVIRPPLFNQVIRQVQFSLQQGQGQTIIQLKPDHLGMMQVQVAVENKIVKTHIVVENEETRRLIEASIPTLRQTLSDQGLRIDQLDVKTDENAFETFQQRQDRTQQNQQFNKLLSQTMLADEGLPVESDPLASENSSHQVDVII